MTTNAIDTCAIILTLAMLALAFSAAGYVFARAMFFLVQSIGFVRAMENQARTNFAHDVADQRMAQPDRKPQVETFEDEDLEAAARAGRAASTGRSHIPGYDTPPPAAGDARYGAEIDGDEDRAPFPGGGLYAESTRG